MVLSDKIRVTGDMNLGQKQHDTHCLSLSLSCLIVVPSINSPWRGRRRFCQLLLLLMVKWTGRDESVEIAHTLSPESLYWAGWQKFTVTGREEETNKLTGWIMCIHPRRFDNNLALFVPSHQPAIRFLLSPTGIFDFFLHRFLSPDSFRSRQWEAVVWCRDAGVLKKYSFLSESPHHVVIVFFFFLSLTTTGKD